MAFTTFDPSEYLESEQEIQFYLGLAYGSRNAEKIARAEATATRARARLAQENKNTYST